MSGGYSYASEAVSATHRVSPDIEQVCLRSIFAELLRRLPLVSFFSIHFQSPFCGGFLEFLGDWCHLAQLHQVE
jgi:hypothetical protein